MKQALMCIAPLLVSCTFVPRASIGIGFADDVTSTGSTSTSKVHTTVRAEADVLEVEHFVLDLGVGLQMVDWSESEPGIEGISRIRWKATDWFEPYFVQSYSILFMEKEHRGLVQLGFGGRVVLTEQWAIDIDYRWWYTEHKRKEWLSQKTKEVGIEGGAVFVGLNYKF